MVNINLNIQKKDLWLLSAIIVFLVGVTVVVAWGSTPTIHGHDAGEIEGGGGFGDWVDMSAVGTAVQGPATTDGFVLAYTPSVGGGVYDIYGYTDSNNPPTTNVIRSKSAAVYGENPSQSFTMPVKKGDYWKVTGTIDKIYWIPLG